MEQWNCPNDRQLSLRAKLGTGWSAHSADAHIITPEEQSHIATVLVQADRINQSERVRIGRLVQRLENLSSHALGDGQSQCYMCAENFGLLSAKAHTCADCGKTACDKCSVLSVGSRQKNLCKVCAEQREFWKRSGAWFFKSIPAYVVAAAPKRSRAHSSRPSVNHINYKTWTRTSSTDSSDSDDEVRPTTNSATESGLEEEAAEIVTAVESKPKSIEPMIVNEGEVVQVNKGFGFLEFSTLFDCQTQQLQILIIRAKGLKAMDSNGLSDPYVKLHLLPGNLKATKLRTKTIHKTLNPEWNETLIYHGLNELDRQHRFLRLCVLDEDTVGADFLGQSKIELTNIPINRWKKWRVGLDDKDNEMLSDPQFSHERGRILISLRYVSQNSQLVVTILRCSNLVSMDTAPDPYVKVTLMPDKRRYKSPTKRRTNNPEYNFECVFHIKLNELVEKSLEVSVWSKDLRNTYIGGTFLGLDSKGLRLFHWCNCLRHPDIEYNEWHVLSDIYVPCGL